MHSKVHQNWFLVFLRGLVETALLLAFVLPALQETGPLSFFVGVVLVGGSIIEFGMAYRMSGHPFRGILFFISIAAAACGAFLLYHHPTTLSLLIVVIGLWLSIRGFAALWLGLSIISGTFDRLLPVLAGIIGLLGGGAVMMWFPVDIYYVTLLLFVYGIAAGAMHFLLTARLIYEKRLRKQRASEES